MMISIARSTETFSEGNNLFYEAVRNDWHQGDIIDRFPFTVSDLNPQNASRSVRLSDFPAIIITQTCDLQRRNFTQVCPIFDFAFLKAQLIAEGKTEQGAEGAIDSIRKGKTEYRFYLPADSVYNINEGFVDLNLVCSIPRQQVQQLNRIASLQDHPRQVLAYFVSNLYVKPHSVE